MRPPWYEGAGALVLGLARSGVAACRLLRRHGCTVRGSDSNTDPEFADSLEHLREGGVEVVLGGQDESLLDGMDLVVVSPGIPPDMPLIKAADGRGMTVISELEAAFQAASAPMLGVTGTNGKSTCVEMLGDVFRCAGTEVAVAGNVGTPLSEVVESVPTSGVLVVEVSSFQLERIVDFRPNVAVLLNVTQDHLDRHGGMAGYLEAKLRIFANQREQDVAVINADQPELVDASARFSAGSCMGFSLAGPVDQGVFVQGEDVCCRWKGREEALFTFKDLRVTGPHNVANAMACAAAGLAMEVSGKSIREGLMGFEGLEHRMEEAAVLDGVKFVNDSKATNPDSLRQALKAASGRVLLIAGGRDKGTPFDDLAGLIKEKTKRVILIGEAAERMRDAWKDAGPILAGSLEDAVRQAWENAAGGDWVLLSPGCASFDMFDDFEDRGRKFKDAVRALARKAGSGLTNGL
jgi:UDP-N-acetylmuramoylalanine--D-glutamate ligase